MMKLKLARATRLPVIYLAITLFTLAQTSGSPNKPVASMRYSCDEKKVLLIASVSTPARNVVPRVDINLTDPSSRQQGEHVTSTVIPESRYEVVAQVATSDEISQEHAIEICGAESGEYRLVIREHADERYRVTVAAIAKENSEYLPLKLQAQEGRVRQFRFRSTSENGAVHLTWLDKHGQAKLIIVDNDW